MNAVVEAGQQLPAAVMDYAADAGAGTEGADRESYAIPFLVVLQPQSPQVGPVPNAKAGAFLNSVTNDVYEKPILIPCAFHRRYVRWGARSTGGGFKGEFSPAQVNELRAKGQVKELDNRLYFPEQDGSVNPERSDRLSDTRNHYCLVMPTPDADMPVPMVFALSSTGIKVSKNFISRITSLKMRNAQGQLFTPPSFSHMYRASTTLKTNEKGRWYLPEIEMVGPLPQSAASIYELAKGFYKQVTEGRIDLAHETVKEEAAGDDRM